MILQPGLVDRACAKVDVDCRRGHRKQRLQHAGNEVGIWRDARDPLARGFDLVDAIIRLSRDGMLTTFGLAPKAEPVVLAEWPAPVDSRTGRLIATE